eukprot:767941-Hanusia_phi.AAC.2
MRSTFQDDLKMKKARPMKKIRKRELVLERARDRAYFWSSANASSESTELDLLPACLELALRPLVHLALLLQPGSGLKLDATVLDQSAGQGQEALQDEAKT